MKVLIALGMMCLLAGDAMASGCDLTVGACYGEAGASNDAGTLDCAAGGTLTLLATFRPAESITEFAGVDRVLILEAASDLQGPAAFWEFGSAHPGALRGTELRPAAGCDSYRNTFLSSDETGFAWGTAPRWLSSEVIASTSYRVTPIAVAADEQLFASSMTLSMESSIEAGGTNGSPTDSAGCSRPVFSSAKGL